MPKDGGHYERGAGDAQSGGYKGSDHPDKVGLPHEGKGSSRVAKTQLAESFKTKMLNVQKTKAKA